MRIACVVGARPNFVKMAPILKALEGYAAVETTLIHTGQHYDPKLSDVFFNELAMKTPDVCLEVGAEVAEQWAAPPSDRAAKLVNRSPDGLDGLLFEVEPGAKNVDGQLSRSIPEPATLALILVGAAMMWRRREA